MRAMSTWVTWVRMRHRRTSAPRGGRRGAAPLGREPSRSEEQARLRRFIRPGPDGEHAEALRRYRHLDARSGRDVGRVRNSVVVPNCDRPVRVGRRADRDGSARPVKAGPVETTRNSMEPLARSAMIAGAAAAGFRTRHIRAGARQRHPHEALPCTRRSLTCPQYSTLPMRAISRRSCME